MLINPRIHDLLSQSINQPAKIYLVGGAIRDFLLGKQKNDLDFVCTDNTREIARKFSDLLGGNFYTLDKERDIYRVLSETSDDAPGVFDFSQMRGASIEDDLAKRDFTINSIAIDLQNPDQLIDPFQGMKHLLSKQLIPVSHGCLEDDPVRVIRAIRYAASYGLTISHELSRNLNECMPNLKSISIERVRDEIFKLLDSVQLSTGLRLGEHFGLFSFLDYGNQQEINDGIDLAVQLDGLFRLIFQGNYEKINQSILTSTLSIQMRKYKPEIQEIFCAAQSTGRSRKLISLFAALLIPAPDKRKVSFFENFGLSTNEIFLISQIQKSKDEITELISGNSIEPRDIYRFFKKVGEVGVDLTLITLAQQLTKPVSEISLNEWTKTLNYCNLLLTAKIEKKEMVNPTPFLTGNDLMFHFDLAPGPRIGELLDALKEEQAAGVVKDKKSALAWVDQRLIKFN